MELLTREAGFVIQRVVKQGVHTKRGHKPEVHLVLSMTRFQASMHLAIWSNSQLIDHIEVPGLLPSTYALLAASMPETGLVKNGKIQTHRLSEAVAQAIQPLTQLIITAGRENHHANACVNIDGLMFWVRRLKLPSCFKIPKVRPNVIVPMYAIKSASK